jgi:transcription-repair coupling factor (superfamily II helicase)
VQNLLAVARFRVLCRRYGITEVALAGNAIRFSPVALPESAQLRLRRLYDRATYKQAVSTISVPRPAGVRGADGATQPTRFGGEPLRDVALLDWCANLLRQVVGAEQLVAS